MRRFVFTAALAIIFPNEAGASSLPSEFSGLWVATEATNNACRKADLKEEKNDAPVARVMSADGTNVNFYETRCTLQSVPASGKPTIATKRPQAEYA